MITKFIANFETLYVLLVGHDCFFLKVQNVLLFNSRRQCLNGFCLGALLSFTIQRNSFRMQLKLHGKLEHCLALKKKQISVNLSIFFCSNPDVRQACQRWLFSSNLPAMFLFNSREVIAAIILDIVVFFLIRCLHQ